MDIGGLSLSPDGKQVAFIASAEEPVNSYTQPDLWVLELVKDAKPRNLASGCAALRFRWLGGAFQQALRPALKLKTRVLVCLATGQRGDPQPANLSPLYRGQVLVHGLGFSPDRKTLAVVSIASNSVTFVDTAANRVKHTTYVGRSPHEPFFSQDGSEVWVTVRGEDYVAVLDGTTYAEKLRIKVPNGPGMTIFSPDGRYAYVCSSFNPETVVISTESHEIVGRVKQVSAFCPNIAATPDGKQVWYTLKDTGKVQVFDAQPPFALLKTIDTGPITNHVNIVRNANGQFAYVTIGGLNEHCCTQLVSKPVSMLSRAIVRMKTPLGMRPRAAPRSLYGSGVCMGAVPYLSASICRMTLSISA